MSSLLAPPPMSPSRPRVNHRKSTVVEVLTEDDMQKVRQEFSILVPPGYNLRNYHLVLDAAFCPFTSTKIVIMGLFYFARSFHLIKLRFRAYMKKIHVVKKAMQRWLRKRNQLMDQMVKFWVDAEMKEKARIRSQLYKDCQAHSPRDRMRTKMDFLSKLHSTPEVKRQIVTSLYLKRRELYQATFLQWQNSMRVLESQRDQIKDVLRKLRALSTTLTTKSTTQLDAVEAELASVQAKQPHFDFNVTLQELQQHLADCSAANPSLLMRSDTTINQSSPRSGDDERLFSAQSVQSIFSSSESFIQSPPSSPPLHLPPPELDQRESGAKEIGLLEAVSLDPDAICEDSEDEVNDSLFDCTLGSSTSGIFTRRCGKALQMEPEFPLSNSSCSLPLIRGTTAASRSPYSPTKRSGVSASPKMSRDSSKRGRMLSSLRDGRLSPSHSPSSKPPTTVTKDYRPLSVLARITTSSCSSSRGPTCSLAAKNYAVQDALSCLSCKASPSSPASRAVATATTTISELKMSHTTSCSPSSRPKELAPITTTTTDLTAAQPQPLAGVLSAMSCGSPRSRSAKPLPSLGLPSPKSGLLPKDSP